MTMNAGALAVAFSMAVLMFYTGILFDSSLFRAQFKRSKLLDFSGVLLANYVVVPVLTLCAIWFFAFPPVLDLVLMTMALLPCAPLVPALVGLSGEPPEQSLFLFLSMSMLNIPMVPILLAMLTVPWIAGSDNGLGGGDSSAAIRYFLSIYGPMSLGASIRIYAPHSAQRCALALRRAMPAMMFITTIIFVYSYRKDLLSLGLRELSALVLFESICLAVGLAFARFVANGKVTSILVTTLRNFAMGIAFTTIIFPNTAAPSLMMTFTSLICAGTATWLIIKSRISSATAGRTLKYKR